MGVVLTKCLRILETGHLKNNSSGDAEEKAALWIKENMKDDTYVSIMAQYFPTYKAKENNELNRKLTKTEWEEIEKYIEKLIDRIDYKDEQTKKRMEYLKITAIEDINKKINKEEQK